VGLACQFNDSSGDPDSKVTGWLWDFGDGGTSTQRHPSHTFLAAGAWQVTLTVTYEGGQDQHLAEVTVSAPAPAIVLTVTGRTDATKQYMLLRWTGATGAAVDVHRSGAFLTSTANDGQYGNSRNLPGSSSYTYTICQTGTSICSNVATVTFGTANAPPSASFTSNCSGLTCTFSDRSTDSDGTVTRWSWTFGDGGTSTVRNPSRGYASAGSYMVTLTVTDDDGATHQRTASVSVAAGSNIVLSVTGRTDATKQYMLLRWTGATGAAVDVYRNGTFLTSTANDGQYGNSRNLPGSSSYTYRVCQTGSTICSNQASVTF
jgi:PKD repeat protein